MTLIIILYSFAIWYISYTLTELDGPMGVFKKLRQRIEGEFSVLNCFYCTAFWVSLFFCWGYNLGFFYIFALAGTASFIHLVHERLA